MSRLTYRMIKMISLAFILAILLALAACGATNETVTYDPQTQTRFNELLENWLPNSGLSIGSKAADVDVVGKERETDYKRESRLKIVDTVALRQWSARDVELMFSDKNGLFGFWIEKPGTCVSAAEAAFGAPMAEGTTGGSTWLVDDLFIWAEDRDDETCFFLVCTAKEAEEKYDTNMELLLNAADSDDLPSSVTDSETATGQEAVFHQLAEDFFPWLSLKMGMEIEQLNVSYSEIENSYPGAVTVIIDNPAELQNGVYSVALTFSEEKGLCGVMGMSSESYLDTITQQMGPSTMHLMYHDWLQDGVFISCEDYETGGGSLIFFTEEQAEIEFSADMATLKGEKASGTDGYVFVSDWTEGNENIYGYGSVYNGTVDQLSNDDDYRFVTQDGWVYYAWVNNGIYKMPVDAADGGEVFKLAPLDNWIYDLSVMKDWLYYFENDQLVRLRTDGMVRETVSLQSEEISDTDGFYLAHDQLYYIGKARRSASEFSYELRKLNLETMEDAAIISGVRRIERGYKDSLFIYTTKGKYARIDLDGNFLAEYSYRLPEYLWDEHQELFVGTIGENIYAGDNLGYIWLDGTTQRDAALSDLGWSAEGYYVCAELGKVVYSVKESGRTIYCTDIATFDTIRLNSDWTEVFYSWGDGYIYYPTSIDKDGRGVRIFCRIHPDGTGWEDVSWMFY